MGEQRSRQQWPRQARRRQRRAAQEAGGLADGRRGCAQQALRRNEHDECRQQAQPAGEARARRQGEQHRCEQLRLAAWLRGGQPAGEGPAAQRRAIGHACRCDCRAAQARRHRRSRHRRGAVTPTTTGAERARDAHGRQQGAQVQRAAQRAQRRHGQHEAAGAEAVPEEGASPMREQGVPCDRRGGQPAAFVRMPQALPQRAQPRPCDRADEQGERPPHPVEHDERGAQLRRPHAGQQRRGGHCAQRQHERQRHAGERLPAAPAGVRAARGEGKRGGAVMEWGCGHVAVTVPRR